MTASVRLQPRLNIVEAARVTRGTLFYVLCLASIATGYYLYLWLGKLKAYYIAWGICLVIVVCLRLANHLRLRRVALDILPVLAWYVYLSLSALWSPSSATTLYFVFAGLVNPVVFLVSYAWARSNSRWSLSAFFEFQTLLILPVIAWSLATIGMLYYPRFGSVRTDFAATCVTALPFLIWRARNRTSIRTVTVLIAALGLILSGDSRAGLLVMPVMVVGAVFFIQQPVGRRGRSLATMLLIIGLLTAIAVSVPAFRSGFSESLGRFAPSQTRLSVSSTLLDEVSAPADAQIDLDRRLQLFVALQSFLDHPILGAGYESTVTIMGDKFNREVSAHGLPSTLLGETGLFGTALFIWMIGRFFRRINAAALNAAHEGKPGFYSTCKLTMVGLLLVGLFHQVDQWPVLFALLAWGYALPLGQTVSS